MFSDKNRFKQNRRIDTRGTQLQVETLEARQLLSITPIENALLTVANPGSSDHLGWSVAASGDTAIVGVIGHDGAGGGNDGMAVIYERNDNGTPSDPSDDSWIEQAQLFSSDPDIGDRFGWSVSISGDTAVVSSPDTLYEPGGSVYLFERNGTTWSQQAKLTTSNAEDGFGSSVSLSGDTLVVGVYGDDDVGPDAGAARVFTRSGTTWSEEAKLVASDAAEGDGFGSEVALEGDTVVIGSWNNQGIDSGVAYVFTREATVWTEQARLAASDGAAGDQFAQHISLSGNTFVVGARGHDSEGSNAGAAYVFANDGVEWSQQAKLTASDALPGRGFGRVGISGDTIVVGQDYYIPDGGDDGGSAYVFDRVGTSWTQSAKFKGSDTEEGDRFGWDVVVEDDTVLVSAILHEASDSRGNTPYNTGAVYAFALTTEAGISVGPAGGLITSESGDTDTFAVALDTAPTANVTIPLISDDPTEGTVSPSSLTFTSTNWNAPQTVVVSGVDDSDLDLDVTYNIVTQMATSADPAYNGLDAADVLVTNRDDELTKTTFASTDVPKSLADASGNTPGTTTSTVNIPAAVQILDIEVTLDIDHSRVADLDLFLVAPDGTRVELMTGVGGSGSDFQGTILDDEAASSIASGNAPFIGSFQPEELLSTLDGKIAQGTWKLEITDRQRKESGTLNDWSLDITHAPPQPNDPPAISSVPVTTATQGSPYSYDVDATDSDAGDTLTYSLEQSPSGMAIDASTGMIAWTPGSGQVGLNNVTVRVVDQLGAADTQSFAIDVANINDPPSITSSPVTTGIEGVAYIYDVDADDPDLGDTLTFSLDVAPSGMTINLITGLIDWMPGSSHVGVENDVIVRVTDAAGVYDLQNFTVDVSAPSANSVYVYDIRFESKRGNKDWRSVFEIRSDSNNSGTGDAGDDPIAGVQMEVTFVGITYTGTTDSNGLFRTSWIRNLSSGRHKAEAVDLALAGYQWDPLALDLEDDDDLNGLPEEGLVR